MSNNKQSSSIEWYIIERHNIEIQSRLGLISLTQYDEQLIKIEEQANAMHKEEMVKFALFFSHAQVSRTNVIDEYNETFGGNND